MLMERRCRKNNVHDVDDAHDCDEDDDDDEDVGDNEDVLTWLRKARPQRCSDDATVTSSGRRPC